MKLVLLSKSSFRRWIQNRSFSTNISSDTIDENFVRCLDYPQKRLNPKEKSLRSRGLFGLDFHRPQDFLNRARAVQHEISTKHYPLLFQTGQEQGQVRELLSGIDNISESLCSILDPAELCRQTHSSSSFRRAATEAYIELYHYLSQLNSDRTLYQLVKEKVSPALNKSFLNEEELFLARQHLGEFERNGIHLDKEERERVAHLQNEISSASAAFIAFPSQFLDEKKTLSDIIWEVSNNQNEAQRREAYYYAREQLSANLPGLNHLLQTRAELARLVGRKSFSEYVLEDKMLTSPNDVDTFLATLKSRLLPVATEQRKLLVAHKQKEHSSSATKLNPWDLSYYTKLFEAEHANLKGARDYFSLGHCLHGIKLLFEKLFGLVLRLSDTDNNETTHFSVQKFEVFSRHEGDALIGTIYLDLFGRNKKVGNSSTFLLEASKHLPDGSLRPAKVAVVCDFENRSSDGPVALLDCSEVDGLFHEFGHVAAALLSRTQYQHASGTRCPIDFAEIPSTMFEMFLTRPDFVQSFARHYKTGEPIPLDVMDALYKRKSLLRALRTLQQVQLAEIDSGLHAGRLSVEQAEQVIGVKWGECLSLGNFSHLAVYGGAYYSYLFSRTLSTAIWARYCAHGDICYETMGKPLVRHWLLFGGAKESWSVMRDLLNLPPRFGDSALPLVSNLEL